MNGPTCEHCAKRPRIRTGEYVSVTCTASECQEAEFYANRERNAHAKRKCR